MEIKSVKFQLVDNSLKKKNTSVNFLFHSSRMVPSLNRKMTSQIQNQINSGCPDNRGLVCSRNY